MAVLKRLNKYRISPNKAVCKGKFYFQNKFEYGLKPPSCSRSQIAVSVSVTVTASMWWEIDACMEVLFWAMTARTCVHGKGTNVYVLPMLSGIKRRTSMKTGNWNNHAQPYERILIPRRECAREARFERWPCSVCSCMRNPPSARPNPQCHA